MDSYHLPRFTLNLSLRKNTNRNIDMKNPHYFRLKKDGKFAGFKRIVTEYLSPGCGKWQLNPIPHDEGETESLSKPAMGIDNLKRESLSGK